MGYRCIAPKDNNGYSLRFASRYSLRFVSYQQTGLAVIMLEASPPYLRLSLRAFKLPTAAATSIDLPPLILTSSSICAF
jgi:hypothetical protein